MKKLERNNLGQLAGGGTTKNENEATKFRFNSTEERQNMIELMLQQGFIIEPISSEYDIFEKQETDGTMYYYVENIE